MKLKFKFLTTTFILFLLVFNSTCFATNNDIMLISETNESTQSQIVSTVNSDLYITNESEYEIKDIINGNVFATVDNLNVNYGIINGNLFATAENINIKSNVTYSDTEKDDIGNSIIEIDNHSSISGNVFVLANKFVLEPGSKIDGDLYICADEVLLEQKSVIGGNVFICANKFNLNSEIDGNLYANVKSFNMKYFGYISRDLYLTAEETILNGNINRNSIIASNIITTEDKFINQGDFTVTDSNNLTFSGVISGDATLNAKNINFKNKDNDKDLICKITGKLSYSSKQEIELPEGIVLKDVTYSSYSNKAILSNILDYTLSLIALLACVYVIYLLISKFVPKYLNNFSNLSGLSLLKYLGIGLGLLILIPIISVLLLASTIGSIIGLIVLLIYIILLLIAKPVFIISIATFAKNKISDKINIYLYMLSIAVILTIICLIPYLGFIVSSLAKLIGFGMIVRNLLPNKNK